MHGHELPLKVSREFGDGDVVVAEPARDVVAVRLALRGELEVEERGVARRHLHAHAPSIRLETAQLPAAELSVRLETGDIERITPRGILLASGEEIERCMRLPEKSDPGTRP